jgi:hypothetical protein
MKKNISRFAKRLNLEKKRTKKLEKEIKKFQEKLFKFLVDQKITDGVAIMGMANIIVAILQNAPAKDAFPFSEELIKYLKENLPL